MATNYSSYQTQFQHVYYYPPPAPQMAPAQPEKIYPVRRVVSAGSVRTMPSSTARPQSELREPRAATDPRTLPARYRRNSRTKSAMFVPTTREHHATASVGSIQSNCSTSSGNSSKQRRAYNSSISSADTSTDSDSLTTQISQSSESTVSDDERFRKLAPLAERRPSDLESRVTSAKRRRGEKPVSLEAGMASLSLNSDLQLESAKLQPKKQESCGTNDLSMQLKTQLTIKQENDSKPVKNAHQAKPSGQNGASTSGSQSCQEEQGQFREASTDLSVKTQKPAAQPAAQPETPAPTVQKVQPTEPIEQSQPIKPIKPMEPTGPMEATPIDSIDQVEPTPTQKKTIRKVAGTKVAGTKRVKPAGDMVLPSQCRRRSYAYASSGPEQHAVPRSVSSNDVHTFQSSENDLASFDLDEQPVNPDEKTDSRTTLPETAPFSGSPVNESETIRVVREKAPVSANNAASAVNNTKPTQAYLPAKAVPVFNTKPQSQASSQASQLPKSRESRESHAPQGPQGPETSSQESQAPQESQESQASQAAAPKPSLEPIALSHSCKTSATASTAPPTSTAREAYIRRSYASGMRASSDKPAEPRTEQRGGFNKLLRVFKKEKSSDDTASMKSGFSTGSTKSGMSMKSSKSTRSLRSAIPKFLQRRKSSAEPDFQRSFSVIDSPRAQGSTYTRSSLSVTTNANPATPTASTAPATPTMPTEVPSAPTEVPATPTAPTALPEPAQASAPIAITTRPATPPLDSSDFSAPTEAEVVIDNENSDNERALLSAGDIFPGKLRAENVDVIVSSVERTGSFGRAPSSASRSSLKRQRSVISQCNVESHEPQADAQRPKSCIVLQSNKACRRSGALAGSNVQFAPQIIVYKTYSAQDYDRTPGRVTCDTLKEPGVVQRIREELNVVKLTMPVHPKSQGFTQFFY